MSSPPGQQPAVAETPPARSERPVVELVIDQTVTVGDLSLRCLKVSDSRCPEGVQCVWEGQVVVTLEVWRAEDEPERVELTLRAGAKGVTAGVAGSELRLLRVEPYPRKGVALEPADYRLSVEVEPS